MIFQDRRTLSTVIILAGVLGVLIGCRTIGFMTKREAVVIVDHALAQSGCTRQDVGIDSSYVITADRFIYQSKEYEVVVDATHDQDRVEKSYRRGRKKSERNINIPWSAVTRVIAKRANLPYGESGYQSVQFFFMSRDSKGDIREESYVISGLVQNTDYARDAVSELVLAIKTLSGLEPAARGSYDHRYTADYGTAPAWKGSGSTSSSQGTRATGVDSSTSSGSTTTYGSSAASSSSTSSGSSTTIGSPTPAPTAGDPTEQELRRIKDLKDRGLITEEVYKERQIEILKAGAR